MSETWTRKQVRELGLVACQAGIESPERLMHLISVGMKAEWRLPLALSGLQNAERALKGLIE